METFELRDNQKKVIDETYKFFTENNSDIYLWAIKCRWGKTFAAYNLANKFNKPLKILILTYKTNIEKEWKDNLNHIHFKDWKFFNKNQKESFLSSTAPVSILFMSFQSLTCRKNSGEFIFKSSYYNWVSDVNFDFLFVDEAHYGASNTFCISFCKERINAKYRLFMSGTPFFALKNDYFKYYSAYDCIDEGNNLDMKLFVSNKYLSISNKEKYLSNFLNKTEYKHIIIYLDRISTCHSISKYLKQNSDFKILDCFDSFERNGKAVIKNIQREINKYKKTVTISCGMGMTGTTIPQWDCILFFGCDEKVIPDSPSVFFQTLFRIQTPYKNKEHTAAYFFCGIESLLFKYLEYALCISITKKINKENCLEGLINTLPIIQDGKFVNYSMAKKIYSSESYQSYVKSYKRKLWLIAQNYKVA